MIKSDSCAHSIDVSYMHSAKTKNSHGYKGRIRNPRTETGRYRIWTFEKHWRNIDGIGSEPEQFPNLGPNCPRTMRIPGSDIEFLVKSEIDLILKKSKPAKFAKIWSNRSRATDLYLFYQRSYWMWKNQKYQKVLFILLYPGQIYFWPIHFYRQ